MIIQAVQHSVQHNAIHSISEGLNRVSKTALDAMNEEIEEVMELKRSGYFVRIEANAVATRLFLQAHTS